MLYEPPQSRASTNPIAVVWGLEKDFDIFLKEPLCRTRWVKDMGYRLRIEDAIILGIEGPDVKEPAS